MKKNKKTFLRLMTAAILGLSMAVSQGVLADNKEFPPGIAKQETIPGKGKHKGWEKGKHKGSETKKSGGETKKADTSLKDKVEKGKEIKTP